MIVKLAELANKIENLRNDALFSESFDNMKHEEEAQQFFLLGLSSLEQAMRQIKLAMFEARKTNDI